MAKFLLLSWKNWLLQWRHPVQIIGNILLPIIFCIIVIVIRSMFEPENHNSIVFLPFEIPGKPGGFNASTTKLTELVWSPCNNTRFRWIMNNIATRHKMSLKCAEDSNELDDILETNIRYTIAGIDFGNQWDTVANISKTVEVILRFPAELRISKDPNDKTIRTWNTDALYPKIPGSSPRNYDDPTGPDPNYYEEGFLTLQYEISKEILRYHLIRNGSNDTTYPAISMRRFPCPSWIVDEGLEETREATLLALCFMFLSVILGLVKDIVDEKQRHLKEIMIIMGSPNCLHWTAWFFKTLVILLIIMGLVTFFFGVPGTNVLTFTNCFLFYIFLTLYACAIITFCFLVSVFFSNAKIALFAILVFWYVTFVPFIIMEYKPPDAIAKTFAMLCLNTAVCFGFKIISKFEAIQEGLQFKNFFVSPFVDNVTMGHVFGMLFLDAILYLLLALYFEGLYPRVYEISKSWFYLCESRNEEISDQDRRIPESDTYQRGPVHTRAIVKIRNLTKFYHNQTVGVQNLSIDIFEGQITVFLGENGSGKTTTLLMLTGMIPPDKGSIFIQGLNLDKHKNRIRSSMTFYHPHHTVLFQDLTVREHLYFFSKLKAVDYGIEVNDEIFQFLELFDLWEHKNTRVAYLNNNIKRKLCLATALCGRSQICILDEPTSGMDPSTRRVLWNFIRTLKPSKTIIMSTTSMDEADYLGDRIAILSNGQLKCYGTNAFLKQKLGAGYHLIIQKRSGCDINRLTEFLKKRIPSIKLISNQAYETVFLLDKHDSVIFANILADLEVHAGELRIISYEITMYTLDEVLVRSKGNDPDIDVGDIKSDKPIGFEKMERVKGSTLWLNQFIALITKKAILSIRSWIILVILILFPLCSLILEYLVSELRKLKRQTRMVIDLKKYHRPTVVVQSKVSDNSSYIRQYIATLEHDNTNFIVWGSKMVSKLLKQANVSEVTYRKEFVIGASHSSSTDTLIAWFNNEPYHSAPLSLQYLMNAIMTTKLSDHYEVNFVNYPLEYSATTKIARLVETYRNVLEIPCTIGITVAIVSALYAIFCIKDRITNSKHLQIMSGVNIYLYWICTYLWDLCTFLVASVCIMAVLFIIRIEGFLSLSLIGPLFFLFLMYGLAILPIMYFFSRCFHATFSAFSIMALINMLLGPITFIVYQNFIHNTIGPRMIYDVLHWFSLLVPSYALTSAIYQISYKSTLNDLCNVIKKEALLNNERLGADGACKLEEKCCDLDENYLTWNNFGIGSQLCYLTIIMILFITLHLIIECYEFYNYNPTPKIYNDDSIDKDVIDEKRKIKTGATNSKNRHVLLQDVTKFYDNKLVVNQLCLGVNVSECFGFLGTKGSGKTTILKILTGCTNVSDGTAWIYGWKVHNRNKQVFKYIGYCPQIDAVLDDLTGKETLILYCMLRGLKVNNCKIVAQLLGRELGFEKQLNRLIRNYTYATKRKLSVAIALIGDSPVLLFDEPTTGIDNISKGKIWNMIIRQRNAGKCIIITSKNLEECEMICTKMAVIVNGSLKCLGAPKYLKRRYSIGYTLTIKIMTPEVTTNSDDNNNNINVTQVIDFIQANFPIATFKECYQNTLIFFIISKSMKWSAIFDIMEHGKRMLNIEEYTIAQSSLEQMFLQYTKLQNND